jgi:hypothetical protein
MLGCAKFVSRINWFAVTLSNIVLSGYVLLTYGNIERHIVCCAATLCCR